MSPLVSIAPKVGLNGCIDAKLEAINDLICFDPEKVEVSTYKGLTVDYC